MKKFYLSIVTACLCAGPAYADEVYGTTPETAKPFPASGWFVTTLDDAPAEAWFTLESPLETPGQWGAAPNDPANPNIGKQIYVYLGINGQEAFQRESAIGTDTYALLPGIQYLVKITPKVAGTFCMTVNGLAGQFMAFPSSWEGTYKYYPKTMEMGPSLSQAPGTTKWYMYNFDYASQVTIKDMTPGSPNYFQSLAEVEEIEAIHMETPGGTNFGSRLIDIAPYTGPYIKKGKNIIGVTIKADAANDVSFSIGLDAMTTINCDKNLLRGQSMELDRQETYPDCYYTVDRYFNVPEDGTYTFIDHGAEGTILTVGKVNRPDPDKFDYTCDWENSRSATIGSDDAKIPVADLKAGDIVFARSDAFSVFSGDFSNQPYLMVVKGDQSGIADVTADSNALKVNAAYGKLTVESQLLANGAEIAVYDMLARKVAGTATAAGTTSAELNLDVTPGVYVVVVNSNGNSESAKIAVK